ncbi:hypothetical protein ACEPAH_9270 [Sanghuangporus vaninii]
MVVFVRTDVEPIDPSLVAPLVSQVYLEQYFQVAFIALLVYDAIITTDREARYFWKIPRKTVNLVYFANRYTGVFAAVSRFYLHSFNANIRSIWPVSLYAMLIIPDIDFSPDWVTVILIDYILMIRVLALYSQGAKLSIVLKTLLALESAFKFGLDIYIVSSDPVVNGGLGKDLTLCGVEGAPAWQWPMVNWIIPMVYGTILMVLALYKAADYWKMSAGFKGFALVKVLIQDQILYFMLVILCSVFNIINFRAERNGRHRKCG